MNLARSDLSYDASIDISLPISFFFSVSATANRQHESRYLRTLQLLDCLNQVELVTAKSTGEI